jgi:hypothetical protein
VASSILTQSSAASITAPGASLAIAALTSTSLPAGTYRFRCYGGYSAGTPGASEQVSGGNIELYVGGVATPLGIPAVLGLFGPFTFDVQLDGSTSISVGTGPHVGSTGVTYDCILLVDQVIGEETVFDV